MFSLLKKVSRENRNVSHINTSPTYKMAESPVHEEEYQEKERNIFARAGETNGDVESGDHGILVKANPLSRELQGRHMQMIAIGKSWTYSLAISNYY